MCFGTSATSIWPQASTPPGPAGVPAARQRGAGACGPAGPAHNPAGWRAQLFPEGLTTRSHAEYVEGDTLESMITEDLVAERIAIDSYAEMTRYIGDDDPTTRRMLEGILAMEEEHAEDLSSLLSQIG